jgi:DNA-binding winged helix-turn-helix (wHTH) protein
VIHFGRYQLDPAQGLMRGTQEVRLTPKSLGVLCLLAEHAGHVVTKEELFRAVWPDTAVTDSALTSCIKELRHALDDDARHPRFIETLHRRGYRFLAPTSAAVLADAERRASCRLVCGTREFQLPDGEHVAGRDADANIWLDSLKVSRRHARVVISGVEAVIEDLESKNGTFVRGVRISAPTELEAGDRIRIGEFSLTFHVARVTMSTETEVAGRARTRTGSGRKE